MATEQQKDGIKEAVTGALIKAGIEVLPHVKDAVENLISGIFHHDNSSPLAKFSSSQLRGLFTNLAKQMHGDDVKIEATGPCCPVGSCCACVNGVPVFC